MVALEDTCCFDGEVEGNPRGTVVPAVCPRRVLLRKGRKIGSWAGGQQRCRFWRFSLAAAWFGGRSTAEICQMVLTSVPRGSKVLVGLTAGGAGEELVEGVIDVLFVSDASWVQDEEDLGVLRRSMTLLPVAWDPKDCEGTGHVCGPFSCVGEAIWDAQERIVGGGAERYAGRRMVARQANGGGAAEAAADEGRVLRSGMRMR
jgi:hypothetical protein